MDTSQLAPLAEVITFHVGAWQEFGYADPPTPHSATIPPLGQRSASAVRASQSAVLEIDQLIAELHKLRAELVSERRQDQDIRMARPLPEPRPSGHDSWSAADAQAQALLDAGEEDQPPRCGDHHPSGITNCTREAEHDGAHHNGSGLVWGAPLDYTYSLPEDYLRGGAQRLDGCTCAAVAHDRSCAWSMR